MRQSMRIISAGALLVGFASGVCGADQPSVQQIIDNAMKGMGGAKALARRDRMTWATNGDYYGMGEATPFAATYALQMPGKYRFEIASVATFVVDGNHGWISQNGKTTELTRDQVDEAREQLYVYRLTLLFPLKLPAYEVTNEGESKLGNQTAVALRVNHKGHRAATLYFDTKTFRLVGVDSLAKSQEEGGKVVRQRSLYSAYKDIDGVPFPMKILILREGKRYVDGVNSDVKFLKEIPAKVFEKP